MAMKILELSIVVTRYPDNKQYEKVYFTKIYLIKIYTVNKKWISLSIILLINLSDKGCVWGRGRNLAIT